MRFWGVCIFVALSITVSATISIEDLSILVCSMDLPISKPTALALVMVESGGNPLAESYTARGLMQVSEKALEDVNRMYMFEFTYDDMFVPEYNILVGSIYFAWLLSIFEIEPLALMAYNWGIGNVNKWLYETNPNNRYIKEKVPKETKDFLVNFYYWLVYFGRGI